MSRSGSVRSNLIDFYNPDHCGKLSDLSELLSTNFTKLAADRYNGTFCFLHQNLQQQLNILETFKCGFVLKLGVILFSFSYCHRQLLTEYRCKFTLKQHYATMHSSNQQYFVFILMPVIVEFFTKKFILLGKKNLTK